MCVVHHKSNIEVVVVFVIVVGRYVSVLYGTTIYLNRITSVHLVRAIGWRIYA